MADIIKETDKHVYIEFRIDIEDWDIFCLQYPTEAQALQDVREIFQGYFKAKRRVLESSWEGLNA